MSKEIFYQVFSVFVFMVTLIGAQQSSSAQSFTPRNGNFEQAFEQFCLHVDLPALDATLEYEATISAVLNLLYGLKDLQVSLGLDINQCLDFGFGTEFDFGASLNLPSSEDLMGCFDLDFDMPTCNFEAPSFNIDPDCMQNLFDGLNLDFDFGFNFDLGSFNQCLDFGITLPDLRLVPEILADLLSGVDFLIAQLEGLQVAFNPDFVLSLQAMASFCGQDAGVGCADELARCKKKNKKLKKKIRNLRNRCG